MISASAGRTVAAPQPSLLDPVFMGRPDKPGDDEQGESPALEDRPYRVAPDCQKTSAAPLSLA